ncbi:MAG: glycosyltransferase [Burkholderiaceae bacterium]
MKVLSLGKYHGDVGGIERHVRALLQSLPPEIQVVNLVANDGAVAESEFKHGISTVRSANYGSFASVALSPAMPALARKLHREQPFDVVHLHFPDPLGHLTALALPPTVRRVITWHSDIVRQRWLLAAYQPFLRSFVRNADALIGATPQHFSSSRQIPNGRPRQIREVIPYGFDPAPLAPSDESRRRRDELLSQRENRALIFSVGRHVYYKGFDVLIRAMRDVDADLIIGGRGPLTASLQRLATELGLDRRITFAGFIPDHLLVAYYEACDVFCMPSVERAEQFGLVQLEAMYCGKPVVATRLGTGVEYVTIDGVTGRLVTPKRADELANALRGLLEDAPLRKKLGDNGRARVLQMFSVEQMVSKTVDVYRRVLAETSPMAGIR